LRDTNVVQSDIVCLGVWFRTIMCSGVDTELL